MWLCFQTYLRDSVCFAGMSFLGFSRFSFGVGSVGVNLQAYTYFVFPNASTERRYLLRVPLILDAKKDCSRHALQSPVSHIVRLILCLFDFRYLPCRCGYNPYAFIAHSVQQRIKLPPVGGFLRVAVRKEKLIDGNMIPGYKVIEHL